MIQTNKHSINLSMNAFAQPQHNLDADKGLFTFYRQQAESQQQLFQQIAKKRKIQPFPQKHHKNTKKSQEKPQSVRKQSKKQQSQRYTSPNSHYTLKAKQHIKQLSEINHTSRIKSQKVKQSSNVYKLQKSLIIDDNSVKNQQKDELRRNPITPTLSMKISESDIFISKKKNLGKFHSINFDKLPLKFKKAMNLQGYTNQQNGLKIKSHKFHEKTQQINCNQTIPNKSKSITQKHRLTPSHFQLPKLNQQSIQNIKKRSLPFSVKQCYRMKDIIQNNQKYKISTIHHHRVSKPCYILTNDIHNHQQNIGLLDVLQRYLNVK